MHSVGVRPHIYQRVMLRRKKYHWFDQLNPRKTAAIIIDMQKTFCEPGSPAEVPQSRGIIKSINSFTEELRKIAVPIIWVLHGNSQIGDKSDWDLFFNNVVADDLKKQTIESLNPQKQKIWQELTSSDNDIVIMKNRYSALITGSSTLEKTLTELDIDTLLICGTKTNICCESTARDAMMLGFKIVMVEDCCAALSDDEHQSALETIIQQFGDVRTSAQVLKILQ